MKRVYQPVEGYSRELCEVSRMCLIANPDHRPDTNRLLGLAGVKAKIRELRIDIVDRADAAKVQQDYGASRQLHRAGEPVGSRRGSAGPSLQGSRGGALPRALRVAIIRLWLPCRTRLLRPRGGPPPAGVLHARGAPRRARTVAPARPSTWRAPGRIPSWPTRCRRLV